MRKVCFIVLLAGLAAGQVFAQTEAPWGGKKNFVSADVGLILGGARYERLLTPHISVGGVAYWDSLFFFWNELEVGGFGRYYIWKGLYGELGLGFHMHWGSDDGWWTTITGFSISPGVGWKFDPGEAGGFFVEPGITLPITLGEKNHVLDDSDSKFGVGFGFVAYCGLGYAF